MKGELTRTAGSSMTSGSSAPSIVPVSEFMRWNDMTTPAPWPRPSLETGQRVEYPTPADD